MVVGGEVCRIKFPGIRPHLVHLKNKKSIQVTKYLKITTVITLELY